METNPENTVFIGNKTTMNYVFAVQTQSKTQTEINILARGKHISKAVDVSQITLDRFLTKWKINNVNVGTDSFYNQEISRDIKTSFINILINS